MLFPPFGQLLYDQIKCILSVLKGAEDEFKEDGCANAGAVIQGVALDIND